MEVQPRWRGGVGRGCGERTGGAGWGVAVQGEVLDVGGGEVDWLVWHFGSLICGRTYLGYC